MYFVQYIKRTLIDEETPFLHQGITKCVQFVTAWWWKPVPFEIWTESCIFLPKFDQGCLLLIAFNYLTSSFSFRILRCSLSTLLESDLKLLYWNNVGTELATNGGFPLSPNSSACKMSSSITTNQMLVMQEWWHYQKHPCNRQCNNYTVIIIAVKAGQVI